MFLEYFTKNTGNTKTGSGVGLEVETDFVDANEQPISVETASALLAASNGRPKGCEQKLELGRQKLEITIAPQPTPALAVERALDGLNWLYRRAEQLGAYPIFAPEIDTAYDLLWVQEERDKVWVQLDGRTALEQLCRCSSVQFTVNVHPTDATTLINQLWASRLHKWDYKPNHNRWLAYIEHSTANYAEDRYSGPESFIDLADYCRRLESHPVVMHQGHPCRLVPSQVPNLNHDLFLRSVWWNYRLRRYSDHLALEIRPLARRSDEHIWQAWEKVKYATGL